MSEPETIPAALDGERLDRVVALLTGASRSRATEWVAEGRAAVNGTVVRKGSARVATGDRVIVDRPVGEAPSTPQPDPGVPVTLVYEDDDVLVVDKPAGLVVHPGAGHDTGTLVHGLLARWPELAAVGDDPARPGVVHRLDKGTSGLLIVARTPAAYTGLVAALAARAIERRYQALVWGHLDAAEGMVDAPIGRSDRDPTKMAVTSRGKEARTRYRVEQEFTDPVDVTLLACRLESGRTHQVRVHLSAIGHPVVGDERYGGRRSGIDIARPFLHAAALAFIQPVTGEPLTFTSPLPADVAEVLARLR